jgi:hypothetical protein
MRFTALFILLLSFSFVALSQQKIISGLVEDEETGFPISYASVTSANGEGLMTDSSGKFSVIVKKQSRLKDSILITAVGYSSRKIAIKDLASNQKILLSQKSKTLEQVKVFASLKGDQRRFGYFREWNPGNKGGEIGYMFELPTNKIQIGQVQVKVNHNYDTCWVKLHLRDAPSYGNSLPENEVLKKETILTTTTRYGLIEFDLGWEPVSVPTNKLYVGFEVLKCSCSQSNIPSFFFMGNEEGLNFFRESGESVWKRGGEYTIYVRMTTK